MKHPRLKKIKCMGCESTSFSVAFGTEAMPRIIMDCTECGCRLSLPTDESQWETPLFKGMPITCTDKDVVN